MKTDKELRERVRESLLRAKLDATTQGGVDPKTMMAVAEHCYDQAPPDLKSLAKKWKSER